MSEQPPPMKSIGAQMLEYDEPLNESDYKDYRMNLNVALDRVERNEKILYHVCWVSFLLAMILMFVGGSGIAGSFDPTSDQATPVSISLGVVYLLASVTWPLAAASLYSRIRPKIRRIRDEIRDANILELRRELKELREQLEKRGE